jgi:hypothetical protein
MLFKTARDANTRPTQAWLYLMTWLNTLIMSRVAGRVLCWVSVHAQISEARSAKIPTLKSILRLLNLLLSYSDTYGAGDDGCQSLCLPQAYVIQPRNCGTSFASFSPSGSDNS